MITNDVTRIINPRELDDIYKLISKKWPTPEEIDAEYGNVNETLQVSLKNIEQQVFRELTQTRERNRVNYNVFCKGDFEMKNNSINWHVNGFELVDRSWLMSHNVLPSIKLQVVGNFNNPNCTSDKKSIVTYVEQMLNKGSVVSGAPSIKKVHFNPPATVVLWEDGTKTVVKAQDGEDFDPEKGLAMAITKKTLGNQGNYYETIKKWCEPYWEKEESEFNEDIQKALERINTLAALAGLMSKKKEDDSHGN